ncbi:multidrug ABC transporter ATP-binding protein [Gordoniibacillus kamchatkensis]|uniref:Multidrug ABC transporter ATP-binding protein n=1 Tax=Gordoniibacillus kamchatkensis TaxID=1590651 RepID=A0ABR5AF19_9BACL|nr:ABC transporter ATP-binding protein [Paenibacillus sp. VKM B-2647]KIL39413.1 multidrug ABC transporter ATP-binding protein [Paenibacillus sp. VKM B-2647]
MTPILEIERLYGGYLPGKPVLKELNLTLLPGEMAGLIGLNGAGKSTTIKHILGLLQPQQGEIRVAGRTLAGDPLGYRAAFAYVPESPELYDELTVREHLELTAMAYGLTREQLDERADRLLDEFRMTGKRSSLPLQLSKGMRQKVMIMNAFLAEPPLYVIDEPFLGLDPLAMKSLLELMVERKKSGASFLISSHILSTIEAYCDKFVVLHRGRIVASGAMTELRRAAGCGQDAALDDVFYELVREGRE